MNTIIISDKHGNRKKISNRDGINLANIQYIKRISDKPNNVNSIISVPNNRCRISSVPNNRIAKISYHKKIK